MFSPYVLPTCKYLAFAQCLCCQQHFNEHIDLIKAQLDPLIDKINEFTDRLTVFNIERMTKVLNKNFKKLIDM